MREINFKFKQKGSLYSSYANIKFNQILLFLRRMLKSKSLHVIRLKRRRRKKTRSHFTFTRKDHHQTTRRKIQIFTTPRISSSITRPVTLVQVNSWWLLAGVRSSTVGNAVRNDRSTGHLRPSPDVGKAGGEAKRTIKVS